MLCAVLAAIIPAPAVVEGKIAVNKPKLRLARAKAAYFKHGVRGWTDAPAAPAIARMKCSNEPPELSSGLAAGHAHIARQRTALAAAAQGPGAPDRSRNHVPWVCVRLPHQSQHLGAHCFPKSAKDDEDQRRRSDLGTCRACRCR